ncbi:MAG: response regulator [Desulfobacterales bacterium]|jgi:CheY-like chemotaxis protein|nr:response regulator [Desulfobacterales bacterium]
MGSILVIEDEKGILGLIEAALLHHGHRVATAGNGKEGVQKFDAGGFDLVITDLLMPEMDGVEVLQHIRSSVGRRTPVIGMSGTPWLLDAAAFDRVLAKPFSLQKLVECVKGLASAAGSPAAPASPRPVFGEENPAFSAA